jgi:hypothetical protein
MFVDAHRGEAVAVKPQARVGPTADLDAVQIAARIPVEFPSKLGTINTIPKRGKENLFEACANTDQQLVDVGAQLQQLVRMIQQTACDYLPKDVRQFDGAFDSAVPPIGSEAALCSPAFLHRVMATRHHAKKLLLAQAFLNVLDSLRKQEIIGRVSWTSSDACSFNAHFYREGTQRNATTNRIGNIDRTVTVTEDTVYHDKNRHQLLSPYLLPCTPRKGMPQRILDLLPSIPRWLGAECVYGKEIVHETETTVHTQDRRVVVTDTVIPPMPQQIYRFDPAIILSNYCLAAWIE